MAQKRHLEQYDSQGNRLDIYLNDDEVMVGEETLADKLSDMESDIEEAAQTGGEGTVTGVKMNGTTIEPGNNGIVDIGTVITQHQDISGKADKSTVPQAYQPRLTAGTGISISGDTIGLSQSAQTSLGKADTAVQSVTINGTPHTPISGVVDLGNLRGQDGNSGVASADNFESVNNLNGGTIDTNQRVYVLGANQGKQLRDQIEFVYQRMRNLYSLLGNIAFWEDKPETNALFPNLEWGNPKHTITLNLSLTHAVVKYNGVQKNNGDTILVEEFSTLRLTIEAESGYALTSVTASSGIVNTDLSYIELVMGQSDLALTITAVGTATYSIAYGTLTNCSVSQDAPSSIVSGGTATIVFSVDSGCTLNQSGINVSGAEIASFSGNTLVIENASGNVTISATATEMPLKLVRDFGWHGYEAAPSRTVLIKYNTAHFKYSLDTNSTSYITAANKIASSDYIRIKKNASFSSPTIRVKTGTLHLSNRTVSFTDPDSGASASINPKFMFYTKVDGKYEFLAHWSYSGGATYRDLDFSTKSAVLTAYQNDNLYIRASFGLSDADTLHQDVKICFMSGSAESTVIWQPSKGYEIVADYAELDMSAINSGSPLSEYAIIVETT